MVVVVVLFSSLLLQNCCRMFRIETRYVRKRYTICRGALLAQNGERTASPRRLTARLGTEKPALRAKYIKLHFAMQVIQLYILQYNKCKSSDSMVQYQLGKNLIQGYSMRVISVI